MSTTDQVPDAHEREMERLSEDECFALISQVSVGRLAVALPHRSPMVVPVNYVVDDHAVLFRTAAGAKLEALRNQPVSFQVDQIDPFLHTGWSVLIRGFAHEVSADTSIESWAPGAKPYWVRIQAEEISGRRILEPDIHLDAFGYL